MRGALRDSLLIVGGMLPSGYWRSLNLVWQIRQEQDVTSWKNPL